MGAGIGLGRGNVDEGVAWKLLCWLNKQDFSKQGRVETCKMISELQPWLKGEWRSCQQKQTTYRIGFEIGCDRRCPPLVCSGGRWGVCAGSKNLPRKKWHDSEIEQGWDFFPPKTNAGLQNLDQTVFYILRYPLSFECSRYAVFPNSYCRQVNSLLSSSGLPDGQNRDWQLFL